MPDTFSIHPQTLLGHVALAVADLDNQIQFYEKVLSLQVHWRDGLSASMGVGGADLLRMTQQSDLKRYGRVTGLYHFAILLPNRHELALVMARLFAYKYRNYPTDHIMTKTTYLEDPEGNGIEVYCESPEDGSWSLKDGQYITRRSDGSLSNGRETLDVEALFKHLTADDRLDVPLPKETRVGHVHLHVRNIDEAIDFYHGLLGFDSMGADRSVRMAFVSAGGYHHHIGLNTWQGAGAPPPPADAVGMRYFSVELPNQAAFDDVVKRIDQAGIATNKTEAGILLHDPSQNGVLVSFKQ